MTIYTHIHHIVPRHIGGDDSPENLIELTVEDHAIAHRHLYKMYGRWEDKVAWLGLSGQIDNQEIIRMKISETNKGNTNLLGYKHSEESLRKISKAAKGRKLSAETRRKLSEAGKNRKPISEESRRKISEAKRGRKLSEEHRRKISEAKKGHNLGYKRSEETRRKISETLKNRHFRQTNDADV
jgi:hypothetical protein